MIEVAILDTNEVLRSVDSSSITEILSRFIIVNERNEYTSHKMYRRISIVFIR